MPSSSRRIKEQLILTVVVCRDLLKSLLPIQASASPLKTKHESLKSSGKPVESICTQAERPNSKAAALVWVCPSHVVSSKRTEERSGLSLQVMMKKNVPVPHSIF